MASRNTEERILTPAARRGHRKDPCCACRRTARDATCGVESVIGRRSGTPAPAGSLAGSSAAGVRTIPVPTRTIRRVVARTEACLHDNPVVG